MKTVLCVIVLAMNCALCVCQVAANQHKPVQNTAKSEQHAAHRPIRKEPSHSSQIVPKPHSASHEPRASKPVGAPNEMSAQRRGSESRMAHGRTHDTTAAVGKTRPARLSTVPRNSSPASSSVRHHNANPPALGGSKSSSAGSTAALNGTRVGPRH